MKNKIMQTIVGTFLGLLMLVVGTQIFVFGQENGINGQAGPTLVGVWKITFQPRNCMTGNPVSSPGQGLSVFNEGGTMMESAGNPALRSPGYGIWEASNPFHPTVAFIIRRNNADGTFAGTNVIRSVASLAQSGNNFTDTTTVEIFDANGMLVGTGCATATAVRFQ